MKTRTPLPWLCLGLLAGGCSHHHYQVELVPVDDQLERTLTWAHAGAERPQFPEEELRALQALYPDHTYDAGAKVHRFQGRFGERMPADIGGSGSYLRMDTLAGSFHSYAERFRGQDDLLQQLEAEHKTIDLGVDLLEGWLDSVLGQEKGFDQLRQFLRTDFRRDLKNLRFLIGQMMDQGLHPSEDKARSAERGQQLMARVAQYLFERGYFQQADLPLVIEGLLSLGDVIPKDLQAWLEEKGETRYARLLQRAVSDRMGVSRGQPLPTSFTFLESEEAREKSLLLFVMEDERAAEPLRRWREHTGQEEVGLGGMLLVMLYGEIATLTSSPARVTVRLALPSAPLASNGRWQEETGRVEWEWPLSGEKLPALCYALWVRADATFQNRHFGRVALAGENLLHYIFWRNALPEELGRQWDDFLRELKPSPALPAQLDVFQFRKTGEAGPVADTALAVRWIKEGLSSAP